MILGSIKVCEVIGMEERGSKELGVGEIQEQRAGYPSA